MKELKELIEGLRKHTVTYISEQTGVHRNTISRILNNENYDPKIGTLMKLHKFLEEHEND